MMHRARGLAATAAVAAAALHTPRRRFIEHTSDPKKWRNNENEEIKRRFRGSNMGGLGGDGASSSDDSMARYKRMGPTAASTTTTTTKKKKKSKDDAAAAAGHDAAPEPWAGIDSHVGGAAPRVGVPLGSERNNQQAIEQALMEKELADWNSVTYYAIGVCVLLVSLNLVMDVVKPNPSPEYVEYVPPEKRGVPQQQGSVAGGAA